MAHPDRGIPTTERVVASVQFGNFDLRKKHAVQEHPFRDRIIFTTPDHSQLEAVGFALDGNGQVDLRDLDFKSVGNEEVNEEYVAQELESMGHRVRRTPERYPENPPPAVNPAQSYQNESNTWPGHILREEGQIPAPGVMQERREMPLPHQSRRPRNTQRWS